MGKPLPIFSDEDDATDLAADAEGVADLDAGRVVDDEAMQAWLESWGKPNELPPPRPRR